MLDLAIGVALYTTPPHIKFPGLATVFLVRSLLRKRKGNCGDNDNNDVTANEPSTGVELRWDNITSTLNTKKTKNNNKGNTSDADTLNSRVILQNVSGKARPGRLLAILGPSGSGKTSLLNVLASQTPNEGNLTLSGSLFRNDVLVRDTKRGREASQIASQAHRKKVAYVRQQDVFFSELTVRETLTLSAKMKSKSNGSSDSIDESVTATLRAVGLSECADARVGDQKKNAGGISGGERKRLALACELVGDDSSSQVVCADEPTSGLDAFQAERVVRSLKKLCAPGAVDEATGKQSPGKTVIASIHQPRGSIVSLFDDVCVLASGKVMFHGPLELVAKWFAAKGHVMANNVNPAEFLIDLASVDVSDSQSESKSKDRVDKLCAAWRTEGSVFLAARENSFAKKLADTAASVSPLLKSLSGRGGGSFSESRTGKVSSPVRALDGALDALTKGNARSTTKPPGFFAHLRLLTARSWRQVTRDSKTNKVRLLTSLNSALVFGSIFWKLGVKQSHVQDRLGLLQVTAINAAMAALMKTISSFTSEKVIVDRERSRGCYGTLPYLIGKLVAELPAGAFFPLCFGAVVYPMCGLNTQDVPKKFLNFAATIVVESFAASAMGLCVSAIAPTPEAATAMGPAVMVMFIVFGGYYVNAENVPFAFRWITKCSLIKHSFQGLCLNEFRGLDFESELRGDTKHGEEVLERLGFGNESVENCLAKQTNVLGFCYLATLYALEKNAPSFQAMGSPATEAFMDAAVVVEEPDDEYEESVDPDDGVQRVETKDTEEDADTSSE